LLPPRLIPEFGWVDVPFRQRRQEAHQLYFVMMIFVMRFRVRQPKPRAAKRGCVSKALFTKASRWSQEGHLWAFH